MDISGAAKGVVSSKAKDLLKKKKQKPKALGPKDEQKDPARYKSNFAEGRQTQFLTGNRYFITQWPQDIGVQYPGDGSGSGPRVPYVMAFFINAAGRSKIAKDSDTTGEKYDKDYTNRWKRSAINLTEVVKKADTALSSVKESAAKEGEQVEQDGIIVSTAKSGVRKIKEALETVLAPTRRRLKDAILLPMPLQLNFSDSVNYAEAGMGGSIGVLLNSIGNAGVGDSLKNAGAVAALEVGRMGAKKFGDFDIIQNAGVQKLDVLFDKAVGATTNPRLEQIFQSTNFREFSFDWQLFPRSAQEVESIATIIQTFRAAMYPEQTSIGDEELGSFLTMPHEFDIEFYQMEFERPVGKDENSNDIKPKFKINDKIPRIVTCVLEGVQTNYTPHGYWSALKDGMPPAISLTLKFKEIEPIHRDLIKKGF